MTTMPPAFKIVANGLAIVAPNVIDFLYVCHNLPADQRRQWEAITSDKYDPEHAALCLASRPGPKWAFVKRDGTPVVVCGYDQIRSGVWQDFLLSTADAWKSHAIECTRFCRKLMQGMLDSGAHRLQAVVLADRADVVKWYRLIGLEYEGTFRCYGSHGEDAVIYSRVNKHG